MRCVLFFVCFFCLSCQHTISKKKEWFFKEWAVNTLSESILTNRVFQNSPTEITSTLIIQGDSLYGLRAYDRDYGNIQWVFPVIGGVEGGIVHSGERVFFGASDGYFYCLEVSTGRVLWKYFTGVENLGAPYVFGNAVYFVTSKDKLFSLNIKTGTPIWIYVHPGGREKSIQITLRGASQPIADSKKVYTGFSDGSFVSIDRLSGKRVWKKNLSKNSASFKDVDIHPIISGNHIYIGSYFGGFFAFNKESGQLLWKNPEGVYSNPTLEGNFIYYPTVSQKIVALHRFSGKVKWSKKTDSYATQPLIYKGTLIFGLSDKGLHVLNKSNGKKLAEVNLFKGLTTKPTLDINNKELFVMSNEFWLYKFNLLF